VANIEWERELYTEVVDEAVERLGIKDRLSFFDIAYVANLVAEAAGVHQDYAAPAENPDRAEIERLTKELTKERSKVGCLPCRGTGRVEGVAGPWRTNEECWKCRGEGKHVAGA
jgi:hypothetical protein